MTGPTPRQQADYLRRLLRRGEIELIDPRTQRAVPTSVELKRDVIRLVPALSRVVAGLCEDADELARWGVVMRRLSGAMCIEEAEELVQAVELQHGIHDALDG